MCGIHMLTCVVYVHVYSEGICVPVHNLEARGEHQVYYFLAVGFFTEHWVRLDS